MVPLVVVVVLQPLALAGGVVGGLQPLHAFGAILSNRRSELIEALAACVEDALARSLFAKDPVGDHHEDFGLVQREISVVIVKSLDPKGQAVQLNPSMWCTPLTEHSDQSRKGYDCPGYDRGW